MNYYNENDKKTAAWLRVLISENLISKGEVDERDIKDVDASDLVGFNQCHFFAGIGGWSYALRLAGWPDDEPVWTGSCPCQPFSTAATNQAQGIGSHRDLWGIFANLFGKYRPSIVFGEQVANAISWGWWDRAAMDCERLDYAVAASVMRCEPWGGAHQRKRLYWLAHAGGQGRQRFKPDNRIFGGARQSFTKHGDALADARRALGCDWADILPRNGVSIAMERSAIHGYGNAIVPQVAAEFIQASIEAIAETAV